MFRLTAVTPHAHSRPQWTSSSVQLGYNLLILMSFTLIHALCRNFLSSLSDDSLLLILNEAVGQLAVSSESSVGAAEVRLILLMADQLQLRLQPLLLSVKGLDHLLDKDWRGQGFDQDLDQLIRLVQSERNSNIRGNLSQVGFSLTPPTTVFVSL